MNKLIHYPWDNELIRNATLFWIWHCDMRGVTGSIMLSFSFFFYPQLFPSPISIHITTALFMLIDWCCAFVFASAVIISDWVLNWGHFLLALWYPPQILLIILWSRCYSAFSQLFCNYLTLLATNCLLSIFLRQFKSYKELDPLEGVCL